VRQALCLGFIIQYCSEPEVPGDRFLPVHVRAEWGPESASKVDARLPAPGKVLDAGDGLPLPGGAPDADARLSSSS
jgi:hypothetical protein